MKIKNHRNKKVTIKQVAEAAGVSTQTVSRVINNKHHVSSETRNRVLKVINQLDYQPSAIAQTLKRQRSYTFGTVIAGLKYIGPSRTLVGITRKAKSLGYSMMLVELDSFTTNDVEPILTDLISHQLDGIIWAVPEVGNNRDWIDQHIPQISLPIIFLTMQSRQNITVISIDNHFGGRLATEHLIDQGFNRIGHIAGPLDFWESRERMAGWKDALAEHNIETDERCWIEGNWSAISGKSAADQLLNQFPEMDAVFAANDQMALGVLFAAHLKGIQVPKDLAVVGFDDIDEAQVFWPPLTSVRQDQYKLGRNAVEELARMVEARRSQKMEYEPRQVTLLPQLSVRRTSILV